MYVSWLFINIKNFGIYRKYRYISTEEFKMKQNNNIEKSNIVKIIIGIIYITILFLFIYLFFSNFTYEEVTSYKFIQTNREFFLNLRENNLILPSLILIICTIFWVLLLGFGIPVGLLAGFIFGKWIGTLLAVFSLTAGATILYILGKYFFSNLIRSLYYEKFSKLENKFKKNEFIFFLLYRFIGGIPFGLANLLPVLFNVRLKNYFFGTFLGILPAIFVFVSLGSGLEKIVGQNEEVPNFIDMLQSAEIYIPIIGFIVIILFSYLLKKKFNKIN
jgi:uncharacterized membrane protein YdjX (TVP38/TMEM64 family)